MINASDTVLFQGDSITDAGRHYGVIEANRPEALGYGYAGIVAATLLKQRPEMSLRFLNRGISGDRVVDLDERWEVDALALEPDVLSILVGVNDTWHELSAGTGVEPVRYEAVYRKLLEGTKRRQPDVQFVLCEPFILYYGDVDSSWDGEMQARRDIVKKLADDFDARFVPFQSAFDHALAKEPAGHWVEDGVHPTDAGHRLMAACWLQTVTGYTGPLA